MKHPLGCSRYFRDAPVCSAERDDGPCGPGWVPPRVTLATGPAGGWFHRPCMELLSVPSRLGLMGLHLKRRLHEMV